MHGKIAELNDKDNSCVIETLAGKIKFDRSAISMEMSQKLNTPPVKK
jgi:preprotein translocase subunit YajC